MARGHIQAMSPHTFSHHDLASKCLTGSGQSLLCRPKSEHFSHSKLFFQCHEEFVVNCWIVCKTSEGCSNRDATLKIIWPNKELEAARAYRHQSKCDNETFYNIHDCADKFRWIVTLNNLGETQRLITSSETNADMHRSKVDVAQAQSYSRLQKIHRNNIIHCWVKYDCIYQHVIQL